MSAASHESQGPLESLIARYIEAEKGGNDLDRDALIAEHPDLAESLQLFFAKHDRIKAAARFEEPTLPPNKSGMDDPTIPPGHDAQKDATTPPQPAGDVLTLPPTEGASQPAKPTIGEQVRYFGDYELLEEIARGGMGVVFKARQVNLNRTVAIKMILSGNLANQEDIRRFYTEAEAAGNLKHANIVAIHEVGEVDGQHFFSMDYVEGQSLAEKVRDHPLPARQAATYVKQIAEVIDYAHTQGTLHRDLKPSNVLIDPDDQPQVTDFGLAKRVDDDSGLTGTGQVLGTPGYMPPEQASGSTDHIGPASDVYGIGAILYELLTGRPPFRAATPVDTIIQVLDAQPVPPRLLNGTVPTDLETVCLKCLEKDPSQRYHSAGELADDLDRFLTGESIHASSINLLDRVTRAIVQCRNDEHFASWGLALMVLGVAIFVSHAWMFVAEQVTESVLYRYWIPRTVMFAVLIGVFCYARPRNMLPTNSAERLIWVLWSGYFLALLSASLILWARGAATSEIFVLSSLLSGYAFFVMGHHVWGGCYLMGLLFFIAAPLLTFYDGVQSLTYGALWGIALLTLGCHYRYRGQAT